MKKCGLSQYFGSILIFAGLFFVYALMTDFGKLLNPLIFPSLGKIFRALIFSRKLLWAGFSSSMRLLFPSLSLAVLLGVSVGTVVGLNEKLKQLFMPIFSALNPIPPLHDRRLPTVSSSFLPPYTPGGRSLLFEPSYSPFLNR